MTSKAPFINYVATGGPGGREGGATNSLKNGYGWLRERGGRGGGSPTKSKMAMVENAYKNEGKFFFYSRIEEKENLTETMQMGKAHIILNRRIKIH